MNFETRSFIAGVLTTTLLTCTAFFIGGWMATNAKEDACTKFGAAIGEETKFITFGLTESKCFTTINGQWTDVNP
jgi:hypothetical protein